MGKDDEIRQLQQQVDDLLDACVTDRDAIRELMRRLAEARAEAARLQAVAEALVQELTG